LEMTDSTDGPARGGVSQAEPGQVVELAVNLDDVSPQVLGDAQRRLLEAGALDVWTIALGMKKQRPGVMLCVLCAYGDRAAFAQQILELTGSFGVRYRSWQRLILDRRYETVTTSHGPVRLKIGSHNGDVVVVRPEYEDVRRLAQSSGQPLRTVMEAAQAAAHQWQHDQDGGHNP
jgi:uncharacterized protein (DUF111 family)